MGEASEREGVLYKNVAGRRGYLDFRQLRRGTLDDIAEDLHEQSGQDEFRERFYRHKRHPESSQGDKVDELGDERLQKKIALEQLDKPPGNRLRESAYAFQEKQDVRLILSHVYRTLTTDK